MIQAFELGLNSDMFISYIAEVVLLQASFTVYLFLVRVLNSSVILNRTKSNISCHKSDFNNTQFRTVHMKYSVQGIAFY